MKSASDNILAVSTNFIEVLEQASALAKLNKPVLVIGERGTGKELVANRLHYLSPRWQEAFVSLNCSGLNDNLLESELFGHEAGSFTGAQKRHQGRFERADGGTLFLDELATAPLSVQEKLLRVIEYGELERVGGSQSLRVDVRLVCATNANLPQLAAEGRFRADLLDRLAFEVIRIPPLRDRKPDIMLLAEHFAIQMIRELGLPYFTGFSDYAQQQLLSYSWPGNVRELKNVIERSVYRHGSSDTQLDNIVINPFGDALAPVGALDLKPTTSLSHMTLPDPDLSNANSPNTDISNIVLPPLPCDLKQWQLDSEKQFLEQALIQSQYNQRKAAELLQLSYDQLRGLIKKHNLSGN
ncbi:phage shock protein operon transcriptional activator [Moellerella wisconsensis]|uniref:Psp operon transcriptional activator n=1 Tax=Moellerella wisconsensis ATCC 35017 TaxID=1354267 RepID=A0A0N0I9R8_9GAMM|nr:phage shock protein operon transcriptional activator [Moellerella wisconsensis]KPD02422.1 psp operon transcriptional activator [Moellerella wisconsensis ATCC 35017]